MYLRLCSTKVCVCVCVRWRRGRHALAPWTGAMDGRQALDARCEKPGARDVHRCTSMCDGTGEVARHCGRAMLGPRTAWAQLEWRWRRLVGGCL